MQHCPRQLRESRMAIDGVAFGSFSASRRTDTGSARHS